MILPGQALRQLAADTRSPQMWLCCSQPTSLLTVLSSVVFLRLLGSVSPHPHTHINTAFLSVLSLLVSPSEHDECASGQNLCDDNAICTNTIRGHLCTCKPGYVGNGTICRGRSCLLHRPQTLSQTGTEPDPPAKPLMVPDPLLDNAMLRPLPPPLHHLTRQQLLPR